jgi:hypothetical protein
MAFITKPPDFYHRQSDSDSVCVSDKPISPKNLERPPFPSGEKGKAEGRNNF